MQDDPEAILRSRRPATRRTRDQSAHANTSDPSSHQTQGQGGSGPEAAQTTLPPQQPASKNQAEGDGDSTGQGTAGKDESITKDGTQADNVASSTNAQEDKETGGPNEDQSKEPPKGGDGHSSAGDKHSLGEEEKEEPDPKRSRHSSTGSGRSGNRENADQCPAETACERVRNSLQALRHAVPKRHVAEESDIAQGRSLPVDALHQAIASVTEAICERGDVRFSLADRVTEEQPAARPGQSMLWAQHRARSDVVEGGHFSLFVITEGEGDQYSVEHRDSYGRMRNDETLQPMWQAVRQQLQDGDYNWNRGGAQQLPQQVQVPAAQCTQTNSWTCGLYTIFNAWVHALGLPRPVQARRTAAGFTTDACDLVKLAMEGTVGSATIRDFLECHNFIVPGAQVPADRSFQQTIALPSPDDLVQRVAQVRLADELHNYQIANPGSDVPFSIDDMLPTIFEVYSETKLELIISIEDVIKLYRHAQEALQPANSFNQADADESDEAAALRLQQEEYGTSSPQPGRDQGKEGASDVEIAQQLQREFDRPTAPRPPPPANDDRPQAPGQSQQQANGASSVPGSGQGQQPAASGERSAGDQQQQTSGNESLQEGSQANDTPVAPGTMNRPGGSALGTQGAVNNTQNVGAANRPGAEAQQPNVQPGVNADQAAGNVNQTTGNANQVAGNANQPNGAAGNQDAEMEARRQRARALLYPENDPFAPGRPLRGPLPGHQAGIDDGVPDLSMFLSQYSNLPRHSEIRQKYRLEDKTRVFDQPAQDAAGAASQGQTQQPDQPAQAAQPAATSQQCAATQEQTRQPDQPTQPAATSEQSAAGQDGPAASTGSGAATQEQTQRPDQPAQPTQPAATSQQGQADQDSPAAPTGSGAAPVGLEAPPSTEAPSGPATQGAPEAPQAPTAPPTAPAPAADVQPPAPAAGQPALPGLQGTIPPAPTAQHAATTDVADPTASTTRAASQGSQSTLRSFDEDQYREDEAARLELQHREQEETRLREFELSTAARREQHRMAREDRDDFERDQAQQESRQSSTSTVTPNYAHTRQSSSSAGVPDLDDGLQAYDPDDEWALNADEEQIRRDEELFGRDPEPPGEDEDEGEGN